MADGFRVVDALPARTPGVVEHLAVWNGRRPTGAPVVVRKSVEEEPPTCYPWLSRGELSDRERRAFNPWRAVRRGFDDDKPWSMQPDVVGVRASELVERLGAGEAELDVVAHIAHELAEAVLLLATSDVVFAPLGDDVIPVGRRRSNMLARPVTLDHVVLGFSGEVALDVVTDSWSNERGVPLDIRDPRLGAGPFHDAMVQWVLATNGVIASLVRTLAGPHRVVAGLVDITDQDALDVLGASPLLPGGRRGLVDMLSAAFSERKRAANDLVEAASLS